MTGQRWMETLDSEAQTRYTKLNTIHLAQRSHFTSQDLQCILNRSQPHHPVRYLGRRSTISAVGTTAPRAAIPQERVRLKAVVVRRHPDDDYHRDHVSEADSWWWVPRGP